MEQRPLGSTGLKVSALGFGCGAVGGLMVRGDPDEQRRAVARALEAGITYFDTAPSYGDGRSETNLGQVMRELGTWHQVVVGTKVRLRPDELATARIAIRASLEASLQRLGRADVDVLHLHNPISLTSRDAGRVDLGLTLGEIAQGLKDVVDAGLTHHVGFTGVGDTAAIHEVLRAEPFETVQSYFNVLNPSAGFAGHTGGQQDFAGLIGAASRSSVGVIAIRVLAAGAATAEPERAANAGDPGGNLVSGGSYSADLDRARTLRELAAKLGAEGPVELAIRFALSVPGVSTLLVGYSTPAHLEAALHYTDLGPLSPEVVDSILQLSTQ